MDLTNRAGFGQLILILYLRNGNGISQLIRIHQVLHFRLHTQVLVLNIR